MYIFRNIFPKNLSLFSLILQIKLIIINMIYFFHEIEKDVYDS